jgi:hypothetical protein
MSEALASYRDEAVRESKHPVLQLQEVSPGVAAACCARSSHGGP